MGADKRRRRSLLAADWFIGVGLILAGFTMCAYLATGQCTSRQDEFHGHTDGDATHLRGRRMDDVRSFYSPDLASGTSERCRCSTLPLSEARQASRKSRHVAWAVPLSIIALTFVVFCIRVVYSCLHVRRSRSGRASHALQRRESHAESSAEPWTASGTLLLGMVGLLMAVRGTALTLTVAGKDECTSTSGGWSGTTNMVLSLLGYATSQAYTLLLIGWSQRKSKRGCKVWGLYFTSVVAAIAGGLWATVTTVGTTSTAFGRLLLSLSMLLMATALGLAATSAPPNDETSTRTLASLAGLGSSLRLLLDFLQVLLFPPLEAACDSGGLSPFLGVGLLFSIDFGFLIVPALTLFDQVAASGSAQVLPASLHVTRAVKLSMVAFFSVVVLGLLGYTVAGVVSAYDNPIVDVRVEFLHNNVWAAVGYAFARSGAVMCTVCVITLLAFVHRYIAHVFFGAVLGVHQATTHRRVSLHSLVSAALVVFIVLHVLGHVVAQRAITHESLRCPAPPVYRSMDALFSLYPAVTGYMMIGSVVVACVYGMSLAMRACQRQGGTPWNDRHTIHVAAALVFVFVYPLHGAEMLLCTRPYNGYVLAVVLIVYGVAYLAGRLGMPPSCAEVVSSRLFARFSSCGYALVVVECAAVALY